MSRLAVTMISGCAFWLLSVQGDAREPIRAPVSDGHLKKVKSYVELDPIPEYQHASEEAYENFRDLKFGIRIHWGVYAMWARDDASWTLYHASRAEKQQYNVLYKTWKPKAFDAEQWMRFFERSGIRIFAFTTKHCDGFSMFDTKTRVKARANWTAADGPKLESCDLAYGIMESPFRRDVVKELCDAAHRHNMKIDLYFSHLDWYDADFRDCYMSPLSIFGKATPAERARMMRRHRQQLTELLSNYGKIDTICLDEWLDKEAWPTLRETMLQVRRLQPDVMFRARGIGNYGDYYTPEGFVPGAKEDTNMPWMVIYPLGNHFSFQKSDHFKGSRWIVTNLIDTVAKGGNFMPAIGPDENGRFDPAAVRQFEAAGAWLRINGEAIYATRPREGTLWNEGDNVRFTRSKDQTTIYALCLKWPGRRLMLKTVRPEEGSTITMLGVRQPLRWRFDNSGLAIDIPERLQAEPNRPCATAWALKIRGVTTAPAVDAAQPIFTRQEVAAYKPKGATKCFRQLCYAYNWEGRRLADLPPKFTRADPVELAEFSKRIKLDAVLLLAVPHHGYCTYETKVGVKFPGIQGDWYGRCIQELHKRDIAVLGYITLGHNWKFMRDHFGQAFVHSNMDKDGVLDGQLCLNAPGYLELVEAYTREVLTMYPVDALRYDMLFSPKRCSCEGCKRYYKELYGQDLTTWDGKGWRRMMDFYLATLDRAVNRLTKTARATKPSVEIWQNHINTYSEANVNLGRQHDIAYIEFGDPLRLLALKGILNKDAIIVGQTLTSPIRRTIMALGARGYQYVSVNPSTALPDKRQWFLDDLAPFFQMVSEVEPYLEGARTLSPIALVYCENTRFRYPDYHRDAYMKVCEQIAGAYLERSLPLDFVNCLDLTERDLCRWKLLVLPATSGLTPNELDVLRRYVRGGGNLLVAGDALRHDPRGMPERQFDLADCLGLQFERVVEDKKGLGGMEARWAGGAVPRRPALHGCVLTKPAAGESLLHVNYQGQQHPLLHVNAVGHRRVAYLASLDCPELTQQTMDWLAGPVPIQVAPAQKRAILTLQKRQNRWILHLLDKGDYVVEIRRDFAAPAKLIGQYPRDGWSAELEPTKTGVRISARGNADDRLLVLQ